MDVCVESCVLLGRGLCDGLITRPENSYRLWCVVVCDLETSGMRRPWPVLGRSAKEVGGGGILSLLRAIPEKKYLSSRKITNFINTEISLRTITI
jgi:hypothetical protein